MHTIIIKFPFAFFKLVSNDVFLNFLNFHNDNNNDFDNIELRNMLKTIIQNDRGGKNFKNHHLMIYIKKIDNF